MAKHASSNEIDCSYRPHLILNDVEVRLIGVSCPFKACILLEYMRTYNQCTKIPNVKLLGFRSICARVGK